MLFLFLVDEFSRWPQPCKDDLTFQSFLIMDLVMSQLLLQIQPLQTMCFFLLFRIGTSMEMSEKQRNNVSEVFQSFTGFHVTFVAQILLYMFECQFGCVGISWGG